MENEKTNLGDKLRHAGQAAYHFAKQITPLGFWTEGLEDTRRYGVRSPEAVVTFALASFMTFAPPAIIAAKIYSTPPERPIPAHSAAAVTEQLRK